MAVNSFSTNPDSSILEQWIDGTKFNQITINLGALPNTTTANVAHGITDIDMTKAVIVKEFNATETAGGVTALSIASLSDLRIDATNVIVTTASDLSAFTGYVTFWYATTTA